MMPRVSHAPSSTREQQFALFGDVVSKFAQRFIHNVHRKPRLSQVKDYALESGTLSKYRMLMDELPAMLRESDGSVGTLIRVALGDGFSDVIEEEDPEVDLDYTAMEKERLGGNDPIKVEPTQHQVLAEQPFEPDRTIQNCKDERSTCPRRLVTNGPSCLIFSSNNAATNTPTSSSALSKKCQDCPLLTWPMQPGRARGLGSWTRFSARQALELDDMGVYSTFKKGCMDILRRDDLPGLRKDWNPDMDFKYLNEIFHELLPKSAQLAIGHESEDCNYDLLSAYCFLATSFCRDRISYVPKAGSRKRKAMTDDEGTSLGKGHKRTMRYMMPSRRSTSALRNDDKGHQTSSDDNAAAFLKPQPKIKITFKSGKHSLPPRFVPAPKSKAIEYRHQLNPPDVTPTKSKKERSKFENYESAKMKGRVHEPPRIKATVGRTLQHPINLDSEPSANQPPTPGQASRKVQLPRADPPSIQFSICGISTNPGFETALKGTKKKYTPSGIEVNKAVQHVMPSGLSLDFDTDQALRNELRRQYLLVMHHPTLEAYARVKLHEFVDEWRISWERSAARGAE